MNLPKTENELRKTVIEAAEVETTKELQRSPAQFQISKKHVKGSKIYKILSGKRIIDARISRNDYSSATVLFSMKDGFEVVYHVSEPVETIVRRPGFNFCGIALLK